MGKSSDIIKMAKTYEADVKGLGIIYKVNKPFDEALKTIKSAGAKVISARDLAYARIQQGKDSSLCNNGSYVREGVLYVQNKTLFIRNSPLLNQKLAKKAVQAHKSGNEFYVDNKLAEEYQEQTEQDKGKQPEKRKTLAISKRGSFNIPTNRFKDEELTLWFFKDQAESYGEFLRENNINKMPVYLSGNNKKNFVNQVWFGGLVSRSELVGSRDLCYDGRVRGVLNSAKGTQSRKSGSKIETYTPSQLKTALKELKMTGLESQLFDALKN